MLQPRNWIYSKRGNFNANYWLFLACYCRALDHSNEVNNKSEEKHCKVTVDLREDGVSVISNADFEETRSSEFFFVLDNIMHQCSQLWAQTKQLF